VTVPSPLFTQLPPWSVVQSALMMSLSTSVATVICAEVSSLVLAVPFTATGASLTGVTSIEAVAVSDSEPSEAEYVKESRPK
jgi:hypothetical protein